MQVTSALNKLLQAVQWLIEWLAQTKSKYWIKVFMRMKMEFLQVV